MVIRIYLLLTNNRYCLRVPKNYNSHFELESLDRYPGPHQTIPTPPEVYVSWKTILRVETMHVMSGRSSISWTGNDTKVCNQRT